jgi:hypothetical protein
LAAKSFSFKQKYLKKLMPYAENLLVEYYNGSFYACLPEVKVGHRNEIWNLSREIGGIKEKDPVLGCLFMKKKKIDKISALMFLGRAIMKEKKERYGVIRVSDKRKRWPCDIEPSKEDCGERNT